MIDFNNLEKYRENNRVEAKKALGGLPKSIWETYSAFANTLGGLILLGVEENPDKSLRPVDLPDPDGLIREFWGLVNDPDKASINILSEKDVYSIEAEGKHIVVIDVPRADRSDKPVYVDGNPLNTYRRNGEGDYRCTKEEYLAMVRDAVVKTLDMRLLTEMDLSVINMDSLHAYRQRMNFARPDHVWEQLDDEAFLQRIGAAGIGEDGKMHPTAAGLLMLGNEFDIVREFGDYFLDYQEQDEAGGHCVRIVSTSGDWSGNVFDFYFRVYSRLEQEVEEPAKLFGTARVDDTSVHKALREALANCLTNADYYGRRGIVIIKKPKQITMANPGTMRIELGAAVSGGVSDPRNGALVRMFNLIDIGERKGSGIPNIFHVWREAGWAAPVYTETMNPDRIELALPLSPEMVGEKKPAANNNDKKPAANERVKESIITYLTDNPAGNAEDIALYVGLEPSRIREYLGELVEEGIVVTEGDSSKAWTYKLRR